eukprot:TRINITY_DN1346_c0_g1_i2.p1 TRINITY_DN1346_c0_g1~~TRINITY_DN1346_c0_g1_i2.p1  ORF type:complete len:291 (-),score=72.03 TRINITY_DN1346_c0_g1_i2:237-1109(-)
MHGNDGVQPKGMFFDIMLRLSKLGYSSLACDQRGYSPNAAPDSYDAYYYDHLAGDVFSIVNASGMSDAYAGKFHLVAHDQGARIGWHAIALGEARRRLLSFTSLSIPHSDVFSDSLYGPTADTDQQEAAQYVRMLTLPNATTAYNGAVDKTVCHGEQESIDACKKALWYYNGAIDAGAMALAPLMTFGSIAKQIGIPSDVVKKLTQYPLTGVAQSVKVGQVSEFPVLYSCGTKDGSDLCKSAFGDESGKLISKFTYLQLPGCGHDVLGCSDATQLEKLHDAIVANVQSSE